MLALKSITTDLRELKSIDSLMKGEVLDQITAESRAEDGKRKVILKLGTDRVRKLILDYARNLSVSVTKKASDNSIELEPDERRLCTRYKGEKPSAEESCEEQL